MIKINALVLRSVFELLFAAVFWGFGFIAVLWCLKEIGPSEITFMRMMIGFSIGALLQVLFRSRLEWKSALSLSFWPAVFLTGTLIFQTFGLQYTTATKSGFITTLYVVMVPVIDALWQRHRIGSQTWGLVVLALIGTSLIMKLEFNSLNVGDLLTLVCAVFASMHIIAVGKMSTKTRHPFLFNTMQSFWVALLVLPLIKPNHLVPKMMDFLSWSPKAIIGLLSLALGSTVFAFYLQVRAQAHLSATVSSILFLLESPFAMIFAVFLLGESLTNMEAVGATLIFIAAFLASLSEVKSEK